MRKLIVIFSSVVLSTCFLGNNELFKDNGIDYNNKEYIDFSFGCDLIYNYNFPDGWWEIGQWWWENEEGDGRYQLYPHEKEFREIMNCFQQMNVNVIKYGQKLNLELPEIIDVEYIRLGDGYSNKTFEENLILNIKNKSNENAIYQLSSDFGVYKCYYKYNMYNYLSYLGKHTCYADKMTSPESTCWDAGNLILYNKNNKKASIINIYSNYESDNYNFRRLFHMNEKNNIMIYDAFNYETFCSIQHKYTINILENGEIQITTIK